MTEGLSLAVACVAGVGIGIFFFGVLWLTVARLPNSRSPAALVLGSLLLRMTVALGGFYLVSAGRWERAIACLAGFVFVRAVMTARLRALDRSTFS